MQKWRKERGVGRANTENTLDPWMTALAGGRLG